MLDAGGGGGVPQIGDAMPQVLSIGQSMVNFANTAAAGGFAVSAEGGQALIDAIDGFQQWINNQSNALNYLLQDRKLGGSTAAREIAPFTREVVTDEQGFITQLKALGESLDKAREGIDKAMQNYQETEQGNAGRSKAIEV